MLAIAATPIKAEPGRADLQVVELASGRLARLPHGSIVLVWASWCVPCLAELGTFHRIAAAGAPLVPATLALDPPVKATAILSKANLPKTLAYATTVAPATVLAQFGGPPPRLPLAFAIDRNGRVCGVRHGLLGTDQVRQWAAQCAK
ncbi:hypothetical protein KZX46_21820 (plasmid) [Polymorphobacter sp. PAMC 29334]|uniref:TlpA family protein disulfide reductase n=1 Tax=Polymorphobacter sp. PAMC 29334 TaxID=2862331 RepID=UPI001C77EC3A|nr:hypothetical protein [Polymorphobacter sp. PAMC 29334]QYE37270.1 hypothetical protein KZX46_21820 [Polymorphobacter sp. PAMC 29334]